MTATVLSLNPQAQQDTVDLSTLKGRQFKKSRHGRNLVVTLQEVGKREVKLAEAGRVDSFTVSIKEFLKFYKAVN